MALLCWAGLGWAVPLGGYGSDVLCLTAPSAGHSVLHHHRQGALHQPVDCRAADCSPPDPHALHEWQAGPAEHGL
eukprot:scaffold63776_cov16-Tisochrysis_lutea.AAC.1